MFLTGLNPAVGVGAANTCFYCPATGSDTAIFKEPFGALFLFLRPLPIVGGDERNSGQVMPMR